MECSAFPGFNDSSWQTFERDGMLVLPGEIPSERVSELNEELEHVAALISELHGIEMSRFGRAVALSEAFLGLIDDPIHFGYAYDLFGELTTLHYAHGFIRRPGLMADTAWHFDGPRVTPHHLYAIRLPLVLKVGWWLTDLTGPAAGNFVYMPGSHRSHQFSAARSFDPVAGEVHLRVPAGSITLMHGGLWHRVLANHSEHTRRNLFFGYCPSWLAPQETYRDLLEAPITLTRRHRILLREYADPHERETPPDEDLPLVEGAETAADYGPLVRKGHRRYPLRIERLLP